MTPDRMTDAPAVRDCPLDEARTIPGLTALAATPAPGTRVLVMDHGDGPRAAAVLDLHGSATEPQDPWLVVQRCGASASGAGSPPPAGLPDPAGELEPLVRAALTAAAADGHRRVTTGCDPMDLPRLKVLEGLGFAATGRQPYFVLGGGHVEYVMGYADASGATMDLAVRLPD
jgi:hypothetical protein